MILSENVLNTCYDIPHYQPDEKKELETPSIFSAMFKLDFNQMFTFKKDASL